MMKLAIAEQQLDGSGMSGRVEFFSGSDTSEPPVPERALAAGVLRQAMVDLRKFRNARGALGRELYSDARSWFVSNDAEWPYSFLNVCRALDLMPEDARIEIFADERAGWFKHSRYVARTVATQFIGSVSNFVTSRGREPLAMQHS
jgi:hypothetical protein